MDWPALIASSMVDFWHEPPASPIGKVAGWPAQSGAPDGLGVDPKQPRSGRDQQRPGHIHWLQPESTTMRALSASLDPAGSVEILLGGAHLAGPMQYGARRVSAIAGGWFKGRDFSGTVMPGGSDWQLIRADGVTEIGARFLVELEGGGFLSVINRGYRHGLEAVMRKLGAGESVDPADYYFGSTLTIEVGPGPLSWMTRTQLVANGAREGDRVRLAVFALTR